MLVLVIYPLNKLKWATKFIQGQITFNQAWWPKLWFYKMVLLSRHNFMIIQSLENFFALVFNLPLSLCEKLNSKILLDNINEFFKLHKNHENVYNMIISNTLTVKSSCHSTKMMYGNFLTELNDLNSKNSLVLHMFVTSARLVQDYLLWIANLRKSESVNNFHYFNFSLIWIETTDTSIRHGQER